MKQIVNVILWLLPLFVSAQKRSEIKFSTAKSWSELLTEAKAANKPIFIDAFTTWCGPCKKMDQEVFTEQSVSAFVNENFVAIRVQMDSTKNDNEFLRNWRKDAQIWSKRILGYPCFLFFNKEGRFEDLELGYHPAKDFLTLLTNAIDPEKSYDGLVKQFKSGKLNRAQLLDRAFRAHKNKDSITSVIARAYKEKYLDPLPVDSFLTPEANKFTLKFYDVFHANDKVVKYMNKYPERADSLVQKEKNALTMSDYFITRDYVSNIIFPGGKPIAAKPQWEKIQKAIADNFDTRTADRIILNSKIAWGHSNRHYDDVARYEFEKIDKYGMDTTALARGFFNNMIYSVVFQNVNDIALLKKAASLMKHVNDLEGDQKSTYIDTYASILYKTGKRNEALVAEKKALELAKKQNNEKDVQFYTQVIERMRKGEEIWKEVKQ